MNLNSGDDLLQSFHTMVTEVSKKNIHMRDASINVY